MSEIKLTADSGGGTVSLKAPATTTGNAAVPFVLPVADGSAGQYLKTDGSKNLAFATVSAGMSDLTPYFMAEDDDSGSGEIDITHQTTTTIAPDEIIDSDSDYNPSTGVWTPTTAGKYWVIQHVCFNTEFNKTFCNLWLYKNGSKWDDDRYNQIRSIVNGTHRFSVTSNYIITTNGSSDYWDTRVYIYDYTGNGNLQVRKAKFGAFKIDD